MSEYQTDSGPMDAIRTHLKAIRTESARMDPKEREERGVAGLAARERLARRLEPLPEPMATLHSRVTARIEELGGTLRPPREPQSDLASQCSGLYDIALASYQIAEESATRDDAEFWLSFGDSIAEQYGRECGRPF
jgi:hypothetical protein